jgi:hypothetical protein
MRPGLIPFICLVGILVASCTPAPQQQGFVAAATPQVTAAEPTSTKAPTSTAWPTNTPRATAVPSKTPTPTALPTITSTNTPIPTDTATATLVPPSNTPIPTDTATLVPSPTKPPSTATLRPPTATKEPTAEPKPEFLSRPLRGDPLVIPVGFGDGILENNAILSIAEDEIYGKVLEFTSLGSNLNTPRRAQVNWFNFDEPTTTPYYIEMPVKWDGQLSDLSFFSAFNQGGDQASLLFMVNFWNTPTGPKPHLLVYEWLVRKNPDTCQTRSTAPSIPPNRWTNLVAVVWSDKIQLYTTNVEHTKYNFICERSLPEGSRQHPQTIFVHGGLYGGAYIGKVWNGPITFQALQ